MERGRSSSGCSAGSGRGVWSLHTPRPGRGDREEALLDGLPPGGIFGGRDNQEVKGSPFTFRPASLRRRPRGRRVRMSGPRMRLFSPALSARTVARAALFAGALVPRRNGGNCHKGAEGPSQRSDRISPIRLIDADGEQLGIVSLDEARIGRPRRGLDLWKGARRAPPVCRLMDYGSSSTRRRGGPAKRRRSSTRCR